MTFLFSSHIPLSTGATTQLDRQYCKSFDDSKLLNYDWNFHWRRGGYFFSMWRIMNQIFEELL